MGNCWMCAKPGNRYNSTRLNIPLLGAHITVYLSPTNLLVRFWWLGQPRAIAQWQTANR